MKNRFREIRKKNKMTIKEVVEELKRTQNFSVKENHIANVEKGRIGFSVELLVAIAILFNVSADYLLLLSDEESRSGEQE